MLSVKAEFFTVVSLGRKTWNMLHIISVNLKDDGVEEFKNMLTAFLDDVYPCYMCKKHLSKLWNEGYHL